MFFSLVIWIMYLSTNNKSLKLRAKILKNVSFWEIPMKFSYASPRQLKPLWANVHAGLIQQVKFRGSNFTQLNLINGHKGRSHFLIGFSCSRPQPIFKSIPLTLLSHPCYTCTHIHCQRTHTKTFSFEKYTFS